MMLDHSVTEWSLDVTDISRVVFLIMLMFICLDFL